MASSRNDAFHLTVPEKDQSLEDKPGNDVILQCQLSPKISAVDMEIRWFKETDCVCLYKNKQVFEGMNYKNRTGLFIEALERGNVSLNLRGFKESDVGVYMCQVISGDTTEEITLTVKERKRKYSEVQSVNETPNNEGRQSHLILQKKRQWRLESTAVTLSFSLKQFRELRLLWDLQSLYTVSCHLRSVLLTWRSGGLKRQTVCLYQNKQVIEGMNYKNRVSLVTDKLDKGNVSLLLKEFGASDYGNYMCQVITGDRIKETTIVLTEGMNQEKIIGKETQLRKLTHEEKMANSALFAVLTKLAETSKCLEDTKRLLNEQDEKMETENKGFREEVKVFSILSGNTNNCNKRFISILQTRFENLREVATVEESDVIMVHCPIVSRAGTDIDAALKKRYSYCAVSKPTVLVVYHHTFDPEKTVPDSSRGVNTENLLTVDCLFYEDTGLLECQKNTDSVDKVVMWIKQELKIRAKQDTSYFDLQIFKDKVSYCLDYFYSTKVSLQSSKKDGM